jgi:hypothetical protein
MSNASVKYTREQIAEAVGKVLDALKRKPGSLASADDVGLPGEMLIDLYLCGVLWIARRDNEVVFGVSRDGRRIWNEAQSNELQKERADG